MPELNPSVIDNPPILETNPDRPPHYFDNPRIRKAILALFPESQQKALEQKLDSATRPTISNNPDQLELYEVGEHRRRIAEILALPLSPLEKLQILLYEGEIFGVNRSPQNIKFASLCPTPGGLLTHSFEGVRNISIEDIQAFSEARGATAREACDSLTDWRQRDQLAHLIANISYPTVLGDPQYVFREHMRQGTINNLLRPGKSPKQESTTWAWRLIQIYQQHPKYYELALSLVEKWTYF